MTPPPRCRLPAGRRVVLSPLREATRGGPPRSPTAVALTDDGERLRVEIVAADPHPWATLRERDADLWTEEVVEVFLAPGAETPQSYFELELNPLGTVFDARIECPHGDRRDLAVDRGWHCAGLETRAELDAAGRLWRAELAIPWSAVGPRPIPERWRLNIFRIDRPPGGDPEFSAWSPTRVEPADFHRPERFGFLHRLV
jgi:hypothetical protein